MTREPTESHAGALAPTIVILAVVVLSSCFSRI